MGLVNVMTCLTYLIFNTYTQTHSQHTNRDTHTHTHTYIYIYNIHIIILISINDHILIDQKRYCNSDVEVEKVDTCKAVSSETALTLVSGKL